MLTARDSIDDRGAGLEAGADDHLVGPLALDTAAHRLMVGDRLANRLRKKLAGAGADEPFETVRGAGGCRFGYTRR